MDINVNILEASYDESNKVSDDEGDNEKCSESENGMDSDVNDCASNYSNSDDM